MQAINVRVSDETKDKLNLIAASERRTLRAEVEALVEMEWQLGGYAADDDGQKDDAA
jgi:predicted transcriptional regulator